MTNTQPNAGFLAGHSQTRQRFLSQMQTAYLHHAWMFHGPKGIGKSLLARQLAAAYLCQSEQRHAGACGACHSCQMLSMDAHPDFSYITREEDKRDFSIGQVRSILSSLQLSGTVSNRKIVLVDNAETMNNQAANALLKGLEEPAAGNVLLIVCHDISRLPATIRSRCMLEPCAPLTAHELTQALQHMHIPEHILELATSISQGRPGHIQALQNQDTAQAMQQWHTIIQDFPKMDIGALQQWCSTHVKSIPHPLIVDLVWHVLQPILHAHPKDFSHNQQFMQAVQQMMQWPRETERHSLRADHALMTYMLQLREVLKTPI